MTARWERPSADGSWLRDDRAWTPYTPAIAGVRFGTNEVQTITVVSTAGLFTVTFGGETTGTLAFNCSAAELQNALEALGTIASGDVTVTKSGDVFTITFLGALATDVEQLTVDETLLSGTATVATITTSGSYTDDPVTLSSNDSHEAEGWYRDAGTRIEARGEIVLGEGYADAADGGWWLVSLPSRPAGYRQHAGTCVLQDASTTQLRNAGAIIQPATDGTAPVGFVIVVDAGYVSTGTNPVAASAPWTWATGDRIAWWTTYEPDSIET